MLSKAREDLYRAGKAKDDPQVTIEQIKFPCQQAVEKSLKAVLSHYAVQYRRGHDVANYLDLLKAANVAFPVALETSIELTPFGAQLRYDYLPPEKRAALSLTRQDMYRLAEQAIAWAAGAVSGTQPTALPKDFPEEFPDDRTRFRTCAGVPRNESLRETGG